MRKKKSPSQVLKKLRDAELEAHETLLLSAYVPYVQEMRTLIGGLPSQENTKPVKVRKSQSSSSCRVASKAFLRTFEWRKLRMQALTQYGNNCMCCGASPSTGAIVNVDHIKPRKFFPELALTLSNLQILCADCNHGKGNWDSTDWRTKERAIPVDTGVA